MGFISIAKLLCLKRKLSGPALVDRLYRPKSMAFELPATLWTVRQCFGVSLARFEVVEEHPSVLPSSPPQLPPQLVTLFAWTT